MIYIERERVRYLWIAKTFGFIIQIKKLLITPLMNFSWKRTVVHSKHLPEFHALNSFISSMVLFGLEFNRQLLKSNRLHELFCSSSIFHIDSRYFYSHKHTQTQTGNGNLDSCRIFVNIHIFSIHLHPCFVPPAHFK